MRTCSESTHAEGPHTNLHYVNINHENEKTRSVPMVAFGGRHKYVTHHTWYRRYVTIQIIEHHVVPRLCKLEPGIMGFVGISSGSVAVIVIQYVKKL